MIADQHDLVNKRISFRNKQKEIMSRNLSDHYPVMCQLNEKQNNHRVWRINEDLLYKQEAIDQIKKDISTYFEINATPLSDIMGRI